MGTAHTKCETSVWAVPVVSFFILGARPFLLLDGEPELSKSSARGIVGTMDIRNQSAFFHAEASCLIHILFIDAYGRNPGQKHMMRSQGKLLRDLAFQMNGTLGHKRGLYCFSGQ